MNRIGEVIHLLQDLGMPRAQQNERSALVLLALLDLTPARAWHEASDPLIGITPIMDWAKAHYKKDYAPNTRETVRRQTMHQFVSAGIALYNPDKPDRPVNSPKAVYQVAPEVLSLLRKKDDPSWGKKLAIFLSRSKTLAARYARARDMQMVPVTVGAGEKIRLSPCDHSNLIKAIIEDFAPRFAPGGKVIYAGDTGAKTGFFDKAALSALGVTVDSHGKMPDVVVHYTDRDWLLLIEAVTSHGPMDGKRHDELAALFRSCSAGLVYVTAFPTRGIMARYLPEIAWETEVWVANAPSHLIHFNGVRILGPYDKA